MKKLVDMDFGGIVAITGFIASQQEEEEEEPEDGDAELEVDRRKMKARPSLAACMLNVGFQNAPLSPPDLSQANETEQEDPEEEEEEEEAEEEAADDAAEEAPADAEP